jgi:RHS repeat-associated protein
LNRATTKTARTGTSCASSPVAYTVTFGYDDITNGNKGYGRRTSLSDSFGNNQTWKYDLQGRVVSTAQTIPGAPANPYTTAFAYDAMDRVRTMTYPDGEVVTTSYNAQGLPDTLTGSLTNFVTATNYNAASQLTSLTFNNTAVTNYTYNANNLRLTDIVTTKSGNTLLNLHYTFDNVGNILSVQDTARGETTNYAYDDLNRLLSAIVTNGPNQYSRSWTYDTLGNITQRVENGATTTYQYNDATSKHAVTHLNNVLKYAYDANGNMTTRDGDTLTYDVENRLTSVTKAGVTTSFVYNGDGTRVKRSVSNAGTTYYVGNYYEVWVPNSGTTTFNKYYYFGAQRVAAKIASTLFYFQGDHLGSSSVVMTQAGTSFYTRQTYFPYGAQRTTEGSALPTDYTFTGQKSDDSTGLMFYGARYYDVSLGRFTQPDTIVPSPLNPQSLNRFSYVRNNPVNLVDPTGHDEEPPCQSWDSWCWENRYWTAQGKCYRESTGEWTRECAPTIQDPGIAIELGLDLLAGKFLEANSDFDYEKYFLALARAAINAHHVQNYVYELFFTGVLGAYTAVGEVNGNCLLRRPATCDSAFGSILQTALARLACRVGNIQCSDKYGSLDGSNTIASVIAYYRPDSPFGPFSSYTGLNRWVKQEQSLISDSGLGEKLQKAFTVAIDVFTGRFWNEGTGFSTRFVGETCQGAQSATYTDFGATGANCTRFAGP